MAARSVPSRRRRVRGGRPVFCVPTVRNTDPHRGTLEEAASISLVVVLPLLPVIATTRGLCRGDGRRRGRRGRRACGPRRATAERRSGARLDHHRARAALARLGRTVAVVRSPRMATNSSPSRSRRLSSSPREGCTSQAAELAAGRRQHPASSKVAAPLASDSTHLALPPRPRVRQGAPNLLRSSGDASRADDLVVPCPLRRRARCRPDVRVRPRAIAARRSGSTSSARRPVERATGAIPGPARRLRSRQCMLGLSCGDCRTDDREVGEARRRLAMSGRFPRRARRRAEPTRTPAASGRSTSRQRRARRACARSRRALRSPGRESVEAPGTATSAMAAAIASTSAPSAHAVATAQDVLDVRGADETAPERTAVRPGRACRSSRRARRDLARPHGGKRPVRTAQRAAVLAASAAPVGSSTFTMAPDPASRPRACTRETGAAWRRGSVEVAMEVRYRVRLVNTAASKRQPATRACRAR